MGSKVALKQLEYQKLHVWFTDIFSTLLPSCAERSWCSFPKNLKNRFLQIEDNGTASIYCFWMVSNFQKLLFKIITNNAIMAQSDAINQLFTGYPMTFIEINSPNVQNSCIFVRTCIVKSITLYTSNKFNSFNKGRLINVDAVDSLAYHIRFFCVNNV